MPGSSLRPFGLVLPLAILAVMLFFCFPLDKSPPSEQNFHRRIKSETASAAPARRSLKFSEESYVFRSGFHFGGPGPPFCL